MTIELLYFDGCPGYEALLARLRMLRARNIDEPIELRRVESDEAAQANRFSARPRWRTSGSRHTRSSA